MARYNETFHKKKSKAKDNNNKNRKQTKKQTNKKDKKNRKPKIKNIVGANTLSGAEILKFCDKKVSFKSDSSSSVQVRAKMVH